MKDADLLTTELASIEDDAHPSSSEETPSVSDIAKDPAPIFGGETAESKESANENSVSSSSSSSSSASSEESSAESESESKEDDSETKKEVGLSIKYEHGKTVLIKFSSEDDRDRVQEAIENQMLKAEDFFYKHWSEI